jgi:hypothetical protein
MFKKIKEVMEFIKSNSVGIIVLGWFILIGIIAVLFA